MGAGSYNRFSDWGLSEEEPADYYHTVAARARIWLAEATTPGLKQQLRDLIDWCEEVAANVASGSENDRPRGQSPLSGCAGNSYGFPTPAAVVAPASRGLAIDP